MILKRYFLLVWANDAGLLLPTDILLISSAPFGFVTPKDFISLKVKARKTGKKRPGKKPGQKP